jgi:poly-D-alanine transfer protein DltD
MININFFLKNLIIFAMIIAINFSYANNLRTKKIQEILIFQGFSVGVADGIVGKKTIKAIKNWQYLNYHPETGFLTELQFEDLKAQYAIKYKLDKSSLEFLENRNIVVEKELLKKYRESNKNSEEIKKNKKALKKEESNYSNNRSSNFISLIIDAIKNLSKNIAFKVLSYL